VYSTSMMRSEWVSVDPFSSIKNWPLISATFFILIL
jgi:hypothetical protein